MMQKLTKLIAARVENLDDANNFVEECADLCALSTKKKFGLLLALEEAFINICSHAYPDGAGDAEISCEGVDDGLILEISDSGKPFDILSLPAPNITLNIEERQIGGLGIHFIRTMSDNAVYRRENDRNILRMMFKRTEE